MDDDYDDDEDGAEDGAAVQLVAPLPWHERGRAGPVSSPATNLTRSPSEASTIFAPQQTPARA